ncbi:hypothetical protein DPMN_029226 [Dreissena polymorpha]|uniref:Uncharacterized protein n=1 Tax=Dreissena polymorpha TaxID=45954 RepID=A0A9D4LYN2_DREPO|nr:hypothetical protein DPMN_029226 [Dreissena polymorpha]
MAEWSSHCMSTDGRLKELTCSVQLQYIIRTNVLTKFHEELTINVTFRVLTRCFSTKIYLASKIIKRNPKLATICSSYIRYSDWTKHVTIRVKKAPRSGGHVFQPTETIFELLHTIFMAFRVLTRFYYSIGTIFELVQDIIRTNILTKFHEEVITRKNACPLAAIFMKIATRVLTRQNAPPLGKNAPPNRGHVFQFHEDRIINVASRVLTWKNAPPSGCHVFQPTGIIFELFHADRTINVASIVLTRFYYSHIMNNAPPPGGHTINMVSIVLTRQMLTPHDAQRTPHDARWTKGDHKSSP